MLSVWGVFLLFCTSCSLRSDVINSFISCRTFNLWLFLTASTAVRTGLIARPHAQTMLFCIFLKCTLCPRSPAGKRPRSNPTNTLYLPTVTRGTVFQRRTIFRPGSVYKAQGESIATQKHTLLNPPEPLRSSGSGPLSVQTKHGGAEFGSYVTHMWDKLQVQLSSVTSGWRLFMEAVLKLWPALRLFYSSLLSCFLTLLLCFLTSSDF